MQPAKCDPLSSRLKTVPRGLSRNLGRPGHAPPPTKNPLLPLDGRLSRVRLEFFAGTPLVGLDLPTDWAAGEIFSVLSELSSNGRLKLAPATPDRPALGQQAGLRPRLADQRCRITSR